MAVIYINVFLFEKSILPVCVREEYSGESDLQWSVISLPIKRVLESIKVRWHVYEYTGASLYL